MNNTSPLFFGSRLPGESRGPVSHASLKDPSKTLDPARSHTAFPASAVSLRRDDPKKLKEACEGLEALFLHTMMREGRGDSSVSISSGESRSLGIVQDMRDEAFGREMARSGGVGLGEMLYQSLSKKAQVSSEIADKISERRNSP